LDWSASLLLDDESPGFHPPTAHNVANLDFDDVTSTQFAIDSEVEQRPVSQTPLMVQPKTNCPNLLGF